MKLIDIAKNSARVVKEYTRANAPTMLNIVGVVGFVAAGVIACKQTTKLSGILEEHREKSEKIKDIADSGLYSDEYTAEDAKNDLRIVTAQTAKDIVKLYALPVGLAALSTFCVFKADKLHKANEAAIGASAVAIKEAYDNYRKSVAEQIGEDKEKDIFNGVETLKYTEINPDTGEQTEKEVRIHKKVEHSPWGFYLDDRSPFLEERCSVLRMEALARIIDKLWIQLVTNGHLYVNDVRRAFGVPELREGWQWGWIWDPKDPKCAKTVKDLGIDIRDSSVDPEVRDFINGYEDFVFINCTPDGIIEGDPRIFRRPKDYAYD